MNHLAQCSKDARLSQVDNHDFSRAGEAHLFLSRAGFSPRGDLTRRDRVRRALHEMGVVEIESEWTGRDRELKVTGGQPRVFLCPS
jgi:hypothetical protein